MAIDPNYIAQQIAKKEKESAAHQDFTANAGYNTGEKTVSLDTDCAKASRQPSMLQSLRQEMSRLKTMTRQTEELAELVALIEKHPDFARMIELYRRYA